MADLSQIKVLDTTYDIKDTTARQGLQGKLSAVAHDGTLKGDGTEANPLKVIGGGQGGGGIPEAPEDGKQYARKDGEWTEVEATFTATYNDTSFADIASAVESGYCVKCDVSGYTYELVQALSDKITFALTNNVNGTISQETIWVTSEDEWDGEGVNLAKASDVPSNAVTSTAVTSIVKVTAMPENPDPNTLYLVVEEEATTASDTSETEGEV